LVICVVEELFIKDLICANCVLYDVLLKIIHVILC